MSVDKARCCGAGQCVLIAPQIFTQDDTDGIVELLVEGDVDLFAESVVSAAEQCPAQCISIVNS